MLLSINVILRLLKAFNFVAVVVVNVVVVALLVVTGQIIFSRDQSNVNLKALGFRLVSVVGGEVCRVIFMSNSNPTTVLRLCCVLVGVVTKVFVL